MDKKEKPNIQDIRIDSAAFAQLKMLIDHAMNYVVGVMMLEGRDKGNVTARINFEINKVMDSEGVVNDKPTIGFKVSFDVPRKNSMTGAAPLNLYLYKDSKEGYILADQQLTMDELLKAGA